MSNGNVLGSFGELVCSVTKALVKIWPEIQEFAHHWSIDPDGLARALRGTLKYQAAYWGVTCHVWGNWGSSIKDLVNANTYDAHEAINDQNFPLTEYDRFSEGKEMGFFDFRGVIDPNIVLIRMESEGFRPATVRELLVYGEKRPADHVVALGQISEIDGGRQAVCLVGNRLSREVHLVYVGTTLSAGFRFLGVRI